MREVKRAIVIATACVLVVALVIAVALNWSIVKNALQGLAIGSPEAPWEINVTNIWHANVSDTTLVAQAGNLDEININFKQVTQNWMGYVGNVVGDIRLDDSANNSFYAWVLVDPSARVYALRNATVNWSDGNLFCANISHIEREELEMNTNTGSSTGQARDGINETFNTTEHPPFSVSTSNFTTNQCNFSVSIFSNDTNPNSGNIPRFFNETLLWAESESAFIFMTHLNKNALGFNNLTYDFQMIVTEDGHFGDNSNTTYYFFVELE